MCLKNKIITTALYALVAGFGIFGIDRNIAQATATDTTSESTVEQLQQTVNQLIEQIRQLTKIINELKPLETCGNGVCRFGETAATCASDCEMDCTTEPALPACAKDHEYRPQYDAKTGCITEFKCGDLIVKETCGDSECETNQNCPQDCRYGNITCAQEGQTTDLTQTKKCCAGLFPRIRVGMMMNDGECQPLGMGSDIKTIECSKTNCGNNFCESGENRCNCPQDCETVSLSVSANSLASKYVYARDQKALIYSLNILANGSDMDVQRVTLQFSGAPYKYLGNIYLYNGNTLLTSSSLDYSTISTVSALDHEITLSNFSNKFVISKGTTGHLDVRADVISPLAGVGAFAKMYVATTPNGIRAVDRLNRNYYGNEPSGSMIIISNRPACGNNVCEAETGESAANCPADCN